MQRYKTTKDTTFFYIYLNQFFIIFEKKFFDKLNDSFEELYHSGDLQIDKMSQNLYVRFSWFCWEIL